jgi:hypothetical protein
MFYVYFNSKGVQEAVIEQDIAPAEGWVAVDGHNGSDRYKLVNGQPVVMTQQEVDDYHHELTMFMVGERLRKERSDALTESDWTQMPDSPLTDAQKKAWQDYRQKLRDLPETLGSDYQFELPEKPQ